MCPILQSKTLEQGSSPNEKYSELQKTGAQTMLHFFNRPLVCSQIK